METTATNTARYRLPTGLLTVTSIWTYPRSSKGLLQDLSVNAQASLQIWAPLRALLRVICLGRVCSYSFAIDSCIHYKLADCLNPSGFHPRLEIRVPGL